MKTKEHHINDWQKQLAEAISDIESLCQHLNIAVEDVPLAQDIESFPLKVPLSFVECMERGNPHDPLLRQILPLQHELFGKAGYSGDPVGDMTSIAEAGVLHKYQGRVLLVLTGACAINCRYCFRRNFPYSDAQLTPQRQIKAMSYLESHDDISEVILSGGDPLLLHDEKFSSWLQRLERIPHLKRIRIHSRLPVVLPARITSKFLDCLCRSNKQIIMVIHANHSHELSRSVEQACFELKQRGITLLNQSVLLKGINDSADVLCQLSERLFSIGVLPYYLHLLDKAYGTAHFETCKEDALMIMDQVKAVLPGYLVPKLVQEIAGATNKLTIC